MLIIFLISLFANAINIKLIAEKVKKVYRKIKKLRKDFNHLNDKKGTG